MKSSTITLPMTTIIDGLKKDGLSQAHLLIFDAMSGSLLEKASWGKVNDSDIYNQTIRSLIDLGGSLFKNDKYLVIHRLGSQNKSEMVVMKGKTFMIAMATEGLGWEKSGLLAFKSLFILEGGFQGMLGDLGNYNSLIQNFVNQKISQQ